MNPQSLLAERRAAVTEMRRADQATRELIQFRIDRIDRELAERQTIAVIPQTEAACPGWSVAQHVAVSK